jgi:succinoglycan biosynthesis protein ExoM
MFGEGGERPAFNEIVEDHATGDDAMNRAVTICIATYKRPAGLKRLLRGIAALEFRKNAVPDIEVLVVDNDPAGEGRSACEELRDELPFRLTCRSEPRRGITYARNTAIASASPHADFIAFLDDDEVPEPNWLDELLAVRDQYQADVVTGPALPHFTSDVPRWVTRGSFFYRPRYPTGQRLPVCATNNVLASRSVFAGRSEPFDNRFALTGGEDYHFFEGVARAGVRIVWADGAVVHEWIPASRTTPGWLVLRQYRKSISHVERELEFQSSVTVWVGRLARGVGRTIQGLLLLPIATLRIPSDGGVHAVLELQRIAHGIGCIAGLMGVKYEEYRKIHAV